MVAALITLAFCAGMAGCGLFLFRRWLSSLDSAARVGLAGLFSLGLFGTILLFLGLVRGGFAAAMLLGWALAVAGVVYLAKHRELVRLRAPQGAQWALAGGVGLAFLFALIGVLAPPDMNEWDSLAYHLAVPKLWLQSGRIEYIPFTHHSNFPFAVDNLYLLGLQWGDYAGAKSFVLALACFGTAAIFGLARQLYGTAAAWWAALAFATAPVVLWLSGTAYIDVPNGLYAGLGIALAAMYLRNPADRSQLWLAAISLGLALGTKYTGLQTLAAVGVVLLLGLSYKGRAKDWARFAIPAAGLALLLAAPWYVKNLAWTANPVYPFFYSRLDGRNWDERRAAIYANEQQTFGVGRGERGRRIADLGHAVLGLGYQPGRYINPMQQQGGGNPLGAIGVAVLGSLVAWAFSGRARAFELANLATVGLSLVMWFFLSQQSRYIVTLAVPLAIMLGGGVARLRAGPVLAGVTALQAGYALWLAHALLASAQLQVVTGKVSVHDYLAQRAPFSEAADEINRVVPPSGKVALYDEVFGYFLDVPYFWANPGHSTVIPYDQMKSGDDFVRSMKALGFTHLYFSFSPAVRSREQSDRLLRAMGLRGGIEPLPEGERQAMLGNWEQKYVALIVDASAKRLIIPVRGFRSGVLFWIVSEQGAEG